MNHHYVPEWYQKQFFEVNQQKYFYLNLHSKKILYRPVKYCFSKEGLYSKKYFSYASDVFENDYFGKIDNNGKKALFALINDVWDKVNLKTCYSDFINYIGAQYLRTPKGMDKLLVSMGDEIFKITKEAVQNGILDRIKKLTGLYGVLWTECVWEVVSANNSNTKFIVSDNPITIYNHRSFPANEESLYPRDPEIQWLGTQTIFPTDLNNCLIMSNKEYIQNNNVSAKKSRTNPGYFREALFNYMDIIRGRELSDQQINIINYIIKKRAVKYIAASKKEWLYPEDKVNNINWSKMRNVFCPDKNIDHLLGESYLQFNTGKTIAQNYLGRRIKNGEEKFRELEGKLMNIINKDVKQ